MGQPVNWETRYLRSPRLIFLSFGFLYLVLVWTSPLIAPLYLLILFTLSAFYLAFLFPTGKEWGDQRRALLHHSDSNAPSEHPPYVKHSRAYVINKRGQVNFTQQWSPSSGAAPRGVVLILHGYADHTGGFKHLTAHWLVKAGYHVAGMDYPGHGRSDGLHVDLPSFDPVLDDVMQVVEQLMAEVRAKHPNTPLFLLSESMGGAVGFLLCTKFESTFAGIIFLAPMCQIAPDMVLPWYVIQGLLLLNKVAPKLAITPTPDVADLCFKKPEVWEQVKSGAVYYASMPRLSTAANMYFSSLNITERLHELRVPFLICHGEDDKVTDPRMSKRMFQEAASLDKTIKLYPKAWHSLLMGEPEDVSNTVRGDILHWLQERTKDVATNGKR